MSYGNKYVVVKACKLLFNNYELVKVVNNCFYKSGVLPETDRSSSGESPEKERRPTGVFSLYYGIVERLGITVRLLTIFSCNINSLEELR